MNTKDIEAARRLIAQFEDRAVGRHNSTMFPARTEGHAAVQQSTPIVNARTVPAREWSLRYPAPRERITLDELHFALADRNQDRIEFPGIVLVKKWEDCRIGECVEKLPFRTVGRIVRVPKPRQIQPGWLAANLELYAMETIEVYDFECVILWHGRYEILVWKRIA